MLFRQNTSEKTSIGMDDIAVYLIPSQVMPCFPSWWKNYDTRSVTIQYTLCSYYCHLVPIPHKRQISPSHLINSELPNLSIWREISHFLVIFQTFLWSPNLHQNLPLLSYLILQFFHRFSGFFYLHMIDCMI